MVLILGLRKKKKGITGRWNIIIKVKINTIKKYEDLWLLNSVCAHIIIKIKHQWNSSRQCFSSQSKTLDQ